MKSGPCPLSWILASAPAVLLPFALGSCAQPSPDELPARVDVVRAADTSWTSRCPDRLTYADGTLLKDGDAYFYPNGKPFVTRQGLKVTVLYPSGHTLKDPNGYYFYSTGTLLASPVDDVLHYPDGSVLREFVPQPNGISEARFFYPNGAVLRDDGIVYYDNGNVAVSGTNFFAPDGTPTTMDAFYQGHTQDNEPYKVDVSIGGFGSVFGPDPGITETSYWFQLYTRIEPLKGLATTGTPMPSLALHYLESNYLPQVLIGWQFPNTRVSLSLYTGNGPVQCDVTIENP